MIHEGELFDFSEQRTDALLPEYLYKAAISQVITVDSSCHALGAQPAANTNTNDCKRSSKRTPSTVAAATHIVLSFFLDRPIFPLLLPSLLSLLLLLSESTNFHPFHFPLSSSASTFATYLRYSGILHLSERFSTVVNALIMPMIFSEHMEHYDLETIFPYRPGVIPPYQRIEVEYVQDPFHFRYPISHSPCPRFDPFSFVIIPSLGCSLTLS